MKEPKRNAEDKRKQEEGISVEDARDGEGKEGREGGTDGRREGRREGNRGSLEG